MPECLAADDSFLNSNSTPTIVSVQQCCLTSCWLTTGNQSDIVRDEHVDMKWCRLNLLWFIVIIQHSTGRAGQWATRFSSSKTFTNKHPGYSSTNLSQATTSYTKPCTSTLSINNRNIVDTVESLRQPNPKSGSRVWLWEGRATNNPKYILYEKLQILGQGKTWAKPTLS